MSDSTYIRGKDGKFAGSTAGATPPKAAPTSPRTKKATAAKSAKPTFPPVTVTTLDGDTVTVARETWQTTDSGVAFRSAKGRIEGTSLVGYVTTTTEHLRAVLGEPAFCDNRPYDDRGDKTSHEWHVEVLDEDGKPHIVTIYDWKSDPPQGQYEWHIGGHDGKAAEQVARLLG